MLCPATVENCSLGYEVDGTPLHKFPAERMSCFEGHSYSDPLTCKRRRSRIQSDLILQYRSENLAFTIVSKVVASNAEDIPDM